MIYYMLRMKRVRQRVKKRELYQHWSRRAREERSAIRGPGGLNGALKELAMLLNLFNEEEEEVGEEGSSHSKEQSQSSGLGERRKEGGEARLDTCND